MNTLLQRDVNRTPIIRNRFSGFSASDLSKPLKRFWCWVASNVTSLKRGVNERNSSVASLLTYVSSLPRLLESRAFSRICSKQRFPAHDSRTLPFKELPQFGGEK